MCLVEVKTKNLRSNGKPKLYFLILPRGWEWIELSSCVYIPSSHGGKPFILEALFREPDGSLRWLLLHLVIMVIRRSWFDLTFFFNRKYVGLIQAVSGAVSNRVREVPSHFVLHFCVLTNSISRPLFPPSIGGQMVSYELVAVGLRKGDFRKSVPWHARTQKGRFELGVEV